jgi:hypothetical protein
VLSSAVEHFLHTDFLIVGHPSHIERGAEGSAALNLYNLGTV